MEEYKIEKGVEIPKKPTRVYKSKYPWREMELWDSVLFRNVTLNLLNSSSYESGRSTGMKFKTRTVDGGVRVWRVE